MHIYIYIGVVKTLTIKQWLFKNWCPSWSDCGSKLMLIQFKVIHNSEYEYTLDLDLPLLVSAVCGCGFAALVCWFPHPSLLPQDPHGPSDLWRGSTSFVLWLLSMPQIYWNVHSPVGEEHAINWKTFIISLEKK